MVSPGRFIRMSTRIVDFAKKAKKRCRYDGVRNRRRPNGTHATENHPGQFDRAIFIVTNFPLNRRQLFRKHIKT